MMPVFGTIAAFQRRRHRPVPGNPARLRGGLSAVTTAATRQSANRPPRLSCRPSGALPCRYRHDHARLRTKSAGKQARERQQLLESKHMLAEENRRRQNRCADRSTRRASIRLAQTARQWPDVKELLRRGIRGLHPRPRIRTDLATNRCPAVFRPARLRIAAWVALLESLPGSFPYTAGVFTFKREGEGPTRMFAGEGDTFRTNRARSCRSTPTPSACRPRSTR